VADEDPPPECRPDDVEVGLTWQLRNDGALSGWVSVRNRGERACRLSNKPAVIPLAADGSPLRVDTIVTLELRIPDHVVLEPGQEARAPVGWGGWNGPPAGDRAVVVWGAERHRTEVPVAGPPQPPSRSGPSNISSGWFRLGD
jgi:hypothetical protein